MKSRVWIVTASFLFLGVFCFLGSGISYAATPPECEGKTATIYVKDDKIVGGPDDGEPYEGVLRGTQGNDFSKLAEARQRTVEAFEKKYLNDLLTRNKGKMNQSATEAGISARQLYKLMTKHGIRKEEFRKPYNL